MKKHPTIIILLIVIALQIVLLGMLFHVDRHRDALPSRFLYNITESDFNASSFKERRDALMAVFSDGIIVISSRAGDDFRYLTGFEEGNSAAVLNPLAEKPFVMFVEPFNLYAAQWTGVLYGLEGAIEKFGAYEAFDIKDLNKTLAQLLKTSDKLYLHSNDIALKAEIEELIKKSKRKIGIHYLDSVVHEMRVVKDDWEIAQMRQAVNVTALAHQRVWETVLPNQKEYEVQAEIEYVFRKNGLGAGFHPITGSGPNATVLHHFKNNREVMPGDLLLVDIGAESRAGYVADITRTIPVSGEFTEEQKTIYELVLKAFDVGIKEFFPGNKVLDPSHKANSVLVHGLYNLGLITDTTLWWQKRFYILHRKVHYIGLHVHDAGVYGDFDITRRDEHILSPGFRGRDLVPGMVFAYEPGLYFMEGKLDHIHELFGHLATEEELNDFVEQVRPVYRQFEGIGVRIEDAILITEDGHEVLSAHLPRKVHEIEKIFSGLQGRGSAPSEARMNVTFWLLILISVATQILLLLLLFKSYSQAKKDNNTAN